MHKRILAVRTLISILLSFIALYFEKASDMRHIYLMLLLLVFVILPVVAYWIEKNGLHFKEKLYFIEVGIVFGLNYMSRFNLNLVFIALYLMLIVESFLMLRRDDALKVGYFTLILLGVNFYLILPYGLNYEVITEMFFLEMILILLMTALYYSKSYWTEKNKVEALLEENEHKRISLEKALNLVSDQNKSLEQAQTEVIRLTRIAERAELASNLHDTLGHEITGLIMQIEMLNMQYNDPLAKDAADHAREILRAMRQTVETLQVNPTSESAVVMLKQKLEAFEVQTQIKTHFKFEINIDTFEAEYRQMIYRTVLEALTNTAKHSNATEVWVTLNVLSSGEHLLKIIDNGSFTRENPNLELKQVNLDNSKEEFEEGNGLGFIRERVLKLGGTVAFKKDAHFGFQMMIKFRGGVHD